MTGFALLGAGICTVWDGPPQFLVGASEPHVVGGGLEQVFASESLQSLTLAIEVLRFGADAAGIERDGVGELVSPGRNRDAGPALGKTSAIASPSFV
jgi:hypothetical protein